MTLHPDRPVLHVEQLDDTTRAKVVARELGEANVHAFGEAVFRLAEEACPHRILLDLGGVTYLTSTALGTLVSLHKKVRAADGQLVLTNVTAAVYEIFLLTRLDRLLDVRPEGEDGSTSIAR